MQRWAQFCLCWCLGQLHWVHGVCPCLNLGTWTYRQDFKTTIFQVFWQLYRFSFYSYTAWQSYRSYHRCILLEKCRFLLCSAMQSSITSTPQHLSTVRCMLVPRDARALSQVLCRSSVIPELLYGCVCCDGARPLSTAAGEVGDDPTMWMGAGLRQWLLLLSPPNALCSPRCGGSWM